MSGDVEFNWYGDTILDELMKAIEEGAQEAADYVLEKSNELVPHDEGTLQGSGHVEDEPSSSPLFVNKAIVYYTPYARRLYFHPEYRFQKGRIGRWMDVALDRHSEKIVDHIAEKVQGVLTRDR